MAFDLEEWALDNLTKVKRSAGSEVEAECPFCRKPGRFYLNTESGSWICFKCGEAGRSPVRVFAKVEDLTEDQARRELFKRSVNFKRRKTTLEDLTLKVESLRPGVERNDTLEVTVELPSEFVPIIKIVEGKKRWSFPVYLRERGFERRTAEFWGLGYCNAGRFANRIIIPIECPNGRSFTARDVTGVQEPKYLNPKGADHRRLVFGFNQVGLESDVVLVEGPLDVLKFWQHGIPAVAMFGKRLHEEQFKLLSRWPASRALIVMTDPDAEDEGIAITTRLRGRFDRVYLGSLPTGVDPGSSTKEQGHEAVQGAKRFDGDRMLRVSRRLERMRRMFFQS